MKLYRCVESFESDPFYHMGKWVLYGTLFLVEHSDDLPGGDKFKNFFTECLIQIGGSPEPTTEGEK